jgi:hypothetical protein
MKIVLTKVTSRPDGFTMGAVFDVKKEVRALCSSSR